MFGLWKNTGDHDPLQSCRGRQGCKECSRKFVVDEETHAENRGYTRDKKEHGGSMWIDFATGTVHNSRVGLGRYNRIEMDRGVVDWHSHPGKCLNDDMCALGLPSPQDIHNVIVGSLFGTKAHMVYAKEGTYLVQIDPALLEHMAMDEAFRKQKQEEIYYALEDLHKDFIAHPSLSYAAYREKWLDKARSLGISVHFFKKDERPNFDLIYACEAEKCGKAMPDVDVPPDEEQLPKRRTTRSKTAPFRKSVATAAARCKRRHKKTAQQRHTQQKYTQQRYAKTKSRSRVIMRKTSGGKKRKSAKSKAGGLRRSRGSR